MSASGMKVLALAAGIYVAYGIVQEELSTQRYGASSERFTQIVFLNLAQCLVCLAWSGAWLLLAPPPPRSVSGRLFWRPALTNTLGPAMGVVALKNISYTAQVLAKSCKLVPVMIAGTLLHGKRYSGAEYAAALLIAAGIVAFALVKNSGAVNAKLAAPHTAYGYLLVFANLWLDAYTNAAQDRIKEHHPELTPQQLMFWMNAWCSAFYTAYMFLLSSAGPQALAFLGRNPGAAWRVLLYCLCGAFGQNCIFMAINSFGSLVNITITTTRKFFGVLLSVFVNKSALRPPQWLAVGLVFSGLGMQVALKRRGHAKHA